MAKKTITSKTVLAPTKVSPVWQIGMLFPDGKKISKPKCTLNDLFITYFLNLDKYLNKEYTAEQLLELYQKTYKEKGIKVVVHYIDSWGHKWRGKIAWPKQDKFIEYLNKKLNNESIRI